MMNKSMFDQLKQSLSEARQIKRKSLTPGRRTMVNIHNDIVQVRGKLGLSQTEFAGIVGVSVDTLQNWEQGRRAPSGPASVLLKIVAAHPKILMETARTKI